MLPCTLNDLLRIVPPSPIHSTSQLGRLRPRLIHISYGSRWYWPYRNRNYDVTREIGCKQAVSRNTNELGAFVDALVMVINRLISRDFAVSAIHDCTALKSHDRRAVPPLRFFILYKAGRTFHLRRPPNYAIRFYARDNIYFMFIIFFSATSLSLHSMFLRASCLRRQPPSERFFQPFRY